MPKFCPTCGKQLQYENAEICPNCGVRIQPVPSAVVSQREIRSPFLAVVLSFFFTGWGQWYCGKTWDGLKIFGAYVVSTILIFVLSVLMVYQPVAVVFVILLFVSMICIWVYGMYDSYKTAEKINKGEETFSKKSGLFWLPVVLIVLVFLLIIAAVFAAFVFGMAGSISESKIVAATAARDGNTIVFTYQGGSDAYQVSKLYYGIGSLTHEWDSPDIGDTVKLYGDASENDHVLMSAEFTDGTQQVILDTYV